jgi:hypothetical protein
MMQGRRVDRCIDVASCQQRRQAGCKAKRFSRLGEIERLYSQAVACQHDPTAITLPNGEGEHAVEPLDATWSPGVVRLNDDLRVASRKESIALRDEFFTKALEIVDAAVEHHGQAEFWIGHRLLRRGGEIKNAEPAVTKGNAVLREESARIWTSVGQLSRHRFDGLKICGASKTDLATQTAHSTHLHMTNSQPIRPCRTGTREVRPSSLKPRNEASRALIRPRKTATLANYGDLEAFAASPLAADAPLPMYTPGA